MGFYINNTFNMGLINMINKTQLNYALEDYVTSCTIYGYASWQALNSLKVYNTIKKIYLKG